MKIIYSCKGRLFGVLFFIVERVIIIGVDNFDYLIKYIIIEYFNICKIVVC